MAWRLGFYRGGPVLMSAVSGINIALWDLKGHRPGVPVHQLLGGKVRKKLSVYAWIGGDRPADVGEAAKARQAQGFKAVKMNATEDVNWLDSSSVLDSSVDRLGTVKALGMDAALNYHGRLHKPMARQLAKALEPHRPLFLVSHFFQNIPKVSSNYQSRFPALSPLARGCIVVGMFSGSWKMVVWMCYSLISLTVVEYRNSSVLRIWQRHTMLLLRLIFRWDPLHWLLVCR
jgi:hypothetical protein